MKMPRSASSTTPVEPTVVHGSAWATAAPKTAAARKAAERALRASSECENMVYLLEGLRPGRPAGLDAILGGPLLRSSYRPVRQPRGSSPHQRTAESPSSAASACVSRDGGSPLLTANIVQLVRHARSAS